jgi:N-glycosyltransferase
VAVPLFADQPHNAARVQAAGAGIAVDAAQAVSALPAAVDRVLSDPSYAENARRIAADIAALPSAAQVLAQVTPAAVH